MNPLFPHATRAIKDALRRDFRAGEIGKLIKEIERATFRRGGASSYLDQVSKRLRGVAGSSMLKRLADQFGRTARGREVEQYARQQWQNSLFNQVFKAFGPLGDVLKAFLRPKGRALTSSLKRELDAASALLKGFGFAVIPPGSIKAGTAATAKQAQKFLEALGFTVTPPPGGPRITPKSPPTTTGKPRKTISLPIGGGATKRFKLTDPILTGEMIEVQSSNVHSIGFDVDQQNATIGTLKVRFLQGKNKTSAGPLYYYFGVPSDLFKKFRKAASKGKWVWSNLRIRGTVSGHRFDYRLMGIKGGYVPRKATLIGREEWYIKRHFRGANGKVYTSGEDMRARYVPNRGTPSPPNRGTPRRGRP